MNADDTDDVAFEPFIQNSQGQFSFTKTGLAEMTKPFAKVGIDIHKITDYESYLLARQAIAPYFTERLLEHLDKCRPNLEIDILKAVARCDFAEVDRLKERLERRYRIGLKAV